MKLETLSSTRQWFAKKRNKHKSSEFKMTHQVLADRFSSFSHMVHVVARILFSSNVVINMWCTDTKLWK